MSWFTVRDIPTAVPSMPLAYDLLADFDGGVQRVQVKSSTCRQHGYWQVGIGQRPYVLDKSARKAPYDPASVDYFFVVVGDGGLYLLPSRAVAGRVCIYVDSTRYRDCRVGDASSLLAWGSVPISAAFNAGEGDGIGG